MSSFICLHLKMALLLLLKSLFSLLRKAATYPILTLSDSFNCYLPVTLEDIFVGQVFQTHLAGKIILSAVEPCQELNG